MKQLTEIIKGWFLPKNPYAKMEHLSYDSFVRSYIKKIEKQIGLKEKNMTEEKALTVSVESQMEMELNYEIKKFEHQVKVAEVWSLSPMVPERFRKNVGSCMIAITMADALKMHPYMVMLSMYDYKGTPGFKAQLIIALINNCGRFTPLEWEFLNEGKGEDLTCRCFATNKETGKVVECQLPYSLAVAEGWTKDAPLRDGNGVMKSKWNTMRRHMMKYRSAAFFQRIHCPEILMGMRSVEELHDDAVSAEIVPGSESFEDAKPKSVKKQKLNINEKMAEMEKEKDIPDVPEDIPA